MRQRIRNILLESISTDAAEVLISDPEHGGQIRNVFDNLANLQRETAEAPMYQLYDIFQSGKMYPYHFEQIGDLQHRLVWSFPHNIPNFIEKVEKTKFSIRDFREESIEQNWAFLQEHPEYNVKGYTDVQQIIEDVERLSLEYSNAHRNLPAYNELQYFSRECAIALGEDNNERYGHLKEKLDSIVYRKSRSEIVDEAGKAYIKNGVIVEYAPVEND